MGIGGLPGIGVRPEGSTHQPLGSVRMPWLHSQRHPPAHRLINTKKKKGEKLSGAFGARNRTLPPKTTNPLLAHPHPLGGFIGRKHPPF